MKLRSYLVRTAYGYAFRLRVPRDLALLLPQQSIKHALRGCDQRQAQLAALILAGRYARAFNQLRQAARPMGNTDKDDSHLINLDEVVEMANEAFAQARFDARMQGLSSPTHRLKELKMGMGANGPFLETETGDSPEVIAQAMKTLEAMMGAKSTPAAPAPAAVKAIAATKAANDFIAHIKPTTSPKTLTIKAAAIDGFVQHYTDQTNNKKALLADASSADVSAWVSMLHQTLAPNYVHSKNVYLQHFFAWAMTNNYYAKGANPAKGHTSFTKKQHQQRLKHGFRAFTKPELLTLFDHANLSTLRPSARWGVVLALYTGARASEIGQLRIADSGIYQDGMLPEDPLLALDDNPSSSAGPWVYTVRFTDEGPGQRLKGADSKRQIFIHDHLIALGLLDRVRLLRDTGEDQLFPGVKFGTVNGAGNWLSKAFTNYREKLVPADPTSPRKVGLHSFRKTTTQHLQRMGGSDALRHYYLGHDPGTVQSVVYADLAPVMQAETYGQVNYGIKFDTLVDLFDQKAALQKATPKVRMTKKEAERKARDGRL